MRQIGASDSRRYASDARDSLPKLAFPGGFIESAQADMEVSSQLISVLRFFQTLIFVDRYMHD